MNLTDESLIESFRNTRNSNHFKFLVRRYQNRIYNAAYRILGNSQEAEEVVQETYLKVHNNLEKYQQQTSFAAWIFRICNNICIDLIRTKQRKNGYRQLTFDPNCAVGEFESADNHVIYQFADDAPCPAQRMILSEQSEQIQKSLEKLPEAQRAVVILHDIEGFSYHEVAEIVGVSLGTVRSRLHYGRQKLRELLESYFMPAHVGLR